MKQRGKGGSCILLTIALSLVSTVAAFAFTDADRDRMDDDWEIAHGLNPSLKDGKDDPDHDGG